MDPLSLLLGGAIAIAGVIAGRLMNSRRHDRRAEQQRAAELSAPRPQPQPICGCGHHLVFHDPKDKICQAQVVIPGRWTGQYAGAYRKCMCQGYRGPMPLEEYYAPDILSEDPGQ